MSHASKLNIEKKRARNRQTDRQVCLTLVLDYVEVRLTVDARYQQSELIF